MNATNKSPRKSILWIGLALLAVLAGAATGWITGGMDIQQPLNLQAATALQDQAMPLPHFSLVDDAGKTFDNERLAGKWSFMFFGYTRCPDVCPTTLAVLDAAMRKIAARDHARNAQVVFVSVDPRRDTPDALKQYVEYFDPAFVGVTGKGRALDGFLRALGIPHARFADPNGGPYLVDHSASILLVGPDGRLVALFSAPHKAELLASDFLRLRDYHEQG
jgi:protein SCO1/2